MKKILNIGIQLNYDEGLIRRIRISNLIAFISLVVMLSYIPLSIVLNVIPAILLILFFGFSSILNFILHYYGQHKAAFIYFTIAGFIYFFCATLFFGLNSNIHYYFLVMCMISAVIFENKRTFYGFILLAMGCFFSLLFIMKDTNGYLIHTQTLIEIQHILGYVVVFLLFIITSIFFIFFKNENVNYQKAIVFQKHIIEEKHKEITDSINYAERIQRSFLATKELLDENLNDYFVFFKPKDVVSGDFYWASLLNNGNFTICCADSTGHGVPGAIMSILNISSLEKSIETEKEPHQVLNETRKIIINRLKKDGSKDGGKDGMDCSLLSLNSDKSLLKFASANNPVIVIRNGVILEYKPDKMPVGKHDKDQVPFTLQTVQLLKGDLIYTLTDGFPDQFGGENGKKYMIKNLKELFLQIAHLPMKEQHNRLDKEFTKWKGGNEQVDDVCIIGIKI
jgi:serine phosphatase RsbU (regulator of sigma subunit)